MIDLDPPTPGALAVAIIRTLEQQGLTLAVAESLTGGAVTAQLVAVPGASAVLRGGIVAYDTALKSSLLGVDAALLARLGPVHEEVAALMSHGVRSAAAIDGHPADIGIATTGVAGPDPQGVSPVGLVFLAVADAAGTILGERHFSGDRDSIRAQAVHAVLAMLADRVGAMR